MATWGEGRTLAKGYAEFYTKEASNHRHGNDRARQEALIEAILAVAARLDVLAYQMEVRG